MSNYYVIKDTDAFGPMRMEEIVILLRDKKVSLSDFIYDVDNKIVDYLGSFERFKSFIPPHPKKNLDGTFFTCRDESVKGPFTYEEIIDMLLTKRLTIFDHLNSNDGTGWTLIKDLSTFGDYLPKIESGILKKLGADITNTNIVKGYIRRYNRSPYSAKTTVTFKDENYIGNCNSISIGGGFIEIKNAKNTFNIGDLIDINIIPDLVNLAIRTDAKVCAVNDTGIAIEFLNLTPKNKQEINDFVNRYVQSSS